MQEDAPDALDRDDSTDGDSCIHSGNADSSRFVYRLFDVLGDRRKRQILTNLAEADAPRSIDDLAEAIADEDSAERHRHLVIRIRHVELPTLERAGFVRVDWNDNRVVSTALTDTLADRSAEWMPSVRSNAKPDVRRTR